MQFIINSTPSKLVTIGLGFCGFITIANGIISENVCDSSKDIYEKYIIGACSSTAWKTLHTWGYYCVIVKDNNYAICHGKRISDCIQLNLTTKDKELMKCCRDLCLVGIDTFYENPYRHFLREPIHRMP